MQLHQESLPRILNRLYHGFTWKKVLHKLELPHSINPQLPTQNSIVYNFQFSFLNDSLWAYNTPLGMFPYKIVCGKACHLPLEMEYKAYWAIKQLNMEMTTVAKQRKLQLCELEELRLFSYENAVI